MVDHSSSSQKRKAARSAILNTHTIRSPLQTYLHLTLLSSSSLAPSSNGTASAAVIDDITVRTHLTSALNQFLGVAGGAISFDILKVDRRDAWIRVPGEDGAAVIEALSAWVGNEVSWRVRRSGTWLGGLSMGRGRDIFED